MPIPFVSSGSRSEIRDLLAFAASTLRPLSELDATREMIAQIRFESAAARIEALDARYGEPFRLAIVGEFKSGKSTLINALLGRPDLLPEGATPTTGAITELRWAETEKGEVLDREGKCVFTGSVSQAARFADQRTAEGKRSSGQGLRVILWIASDLLRGLVILDTPGLGANKIDDATTFGVLDFADAAFLVVNGLQPGAEESLTLSESLRTARRKLVVIVTRIDLVAIPDDAVAAAASVFKAIAVGSPIGVSSPNILVALSDLAAADAKRDADAIASANSRLQACGYFGIRERLLETSAGGDPAGGRASRTLADLRLILHRLQSNAAEESNTKRAKAEALASDRAEIDDRVSRELRPKIPYLEGKIDEIVDNHVSEFVAELSDAVDVFVDRIADGGLDLGVRSIAAKFSDNQRKIFDSRLKREFYEIFPDDQLALITEKIELGIRRLMEFEWHEVSARVAMPNKTVEFDPAQLVNEVCNHVGEMTAAVAAEMAAWIALLLIPGGIIVNVAALLLSLGAGKYIAGKENARITLAKRQARVRLRAMRRQLTNRVAKGFLELNRTTADALINRATQQSSEKAKEAAALDTLIERWRAAHVDIQRLLLACEEMESTGGGQS